MSLCHLWRHAAVTCMAAACVFVFGLVPALAGSTGNLTGSVTNQKGAAVAGASISAVAASGSYKAVSDSHGFYSILNMSPDTYALTVTSSGYETAVTNGITVFQDQNATVNVQLRPSIATIGRIPVTAARTNLVQPNVTSNTYNITSAQQEAILNDKTHHTLYDVLWRAPGVTSGPASGSPIIRGGINTELGWEFDEIPIVDRTVGFYVTELSTTGIGNVQVTTGGLTAQQGGSNGGVVNMVVKSGTYPTNGFVAAGVGGPAYTHSLDFELGTATPDNSWSIFTAGSYTNDDNRYGDPNKFYYELVEGFDWVNTKDTMVNIHHRFGQNQKDDLQFVADVGVGIFRSSYGGAQDSQLAVNGAFVSGGNLFYNLVRKQNADAWYHWYNIDKLSFSHTINDRSFYKLRVAQSRNGYYFDELWAANVGETCLAGGCTTIQPGIINSNDVWCYGCYYQDRHTLQTFFNADYADQVGEHNLIRFGTGYEMDDNFRKVAPFTANIDVSGNWPDYRTVTLAPTHIWSTYVSDHISAGKWVVEPGLRWDMERYSISAVRDANGVEAPGTAHPFTESFLSPRVAFTFQSSPTDVFRASYGLLGGFIGTAYAENFTVDQFAAQGTSQHGPSFVPLKPAVAKSYDFSWEHLFPSQVSLRVTPYAHNNDNYVVEYRVPANIDPLRPTFFVNGAATHTRGVEVALAREVSTGLSSYFAFTYNDTKSNVVALQGPFFGSRSTSVLANILAKNFVPAGYAAPWTANLSLDYKHQGWQIISNTTWATAFPYGIGRFAWGFDSSGNLVLNPNDCTQTNQGKICLASNEGKFANSLRGPAWFNENLSLAHTLGHGKVGMTVTNLFNERTSPIPSSNSNYENTDSSGNWTPTGQCPVVTSPQPGGLCFNTAYPAANAATYPADGYYRQTSGLQRLITAWYTLNI